MKNSSNIKATFSVGPKPGQPIVMDALYPGSTTVSQRATAIERLVRVVASGDEFFGGEESRDFRSPIIQSPTWGQLNGVAGRQMRRTGDTHHRYLEGFYLAGTEVDKQGRTIQLLELSMGS